MVCDFCHMAKNLREKCYCIHGYPSWHRLFGKPKPKPKVMTSRGAVVANITSNSGQHLSIQESVSSGVQMSHMSKLIT